MSAKQDKPGGNRGALSQAAADILRQLFGPAAKEFGGLFGEEVASWRAANVDRLAMKWRERLARKGVAEAAIKKLPFGDALRVLRTVSEEDDESVQELWAGLLAAAADPRSSVKVKRVYERILKAIGPVEATVLRFFWLRYLKADTAVGSVTSPEVGKFIRRELRKFDPDDRVTAIQNLLREQCIIRILDDSLLENINNLDKMSDAMQTLLRVISGDLDSSYFGRLRDRKEKNWVPELAFRLSPLGVELMEVCEDFYGDLS